VTEGVYIGLDLGTSGLKGVALATSGTVVARGGAAYATRRPAAAAAEQAPADWLSAVEAVAGQLRRVVPPERWRGIGLSAMIPTLVTADADGEPTGPAITWQDSRASAHGDALRDRCGAGALYRATGQWVDGRYLLPMFLRIAGAEPSRAAATTRLLAAKDYVFGWLTGEIATDPSTASGFGCFELQSGGWHGDVLAAAASLAGRALPGRVLPDMPPVLPATASRPLRARAAARLGCGEIPVCLGAADSVLGALGLGVRDPGQVAYIAGSSSVILGVAGRLLFDPQHRFLVTPLAEPGRWGLEMDLLATGSAIGWLAGLLGGLDEPALVSLAAGTDPCDAPLVLPYLSPGEQGALWDPLLHGTVAGLELGHSRRHLARGLVNGIVLESRRCLAVLDETGLFGRDLKVAGSSAVHPGLRSDLADATRRRVGMPGDHDTDYSALGAAQLTARAVGGEWPPAPPWVGEPSAEPAPERAAAWDRLWDDYERARHAIARHYHSPPSSTPLWLRRPRRRAPRHSTSTRYSLPRQPTRLSPCDDRQRLAARDHPFPSFLVQRMPAGEASRLGAFLVILGKALPAARNAPITQPDGARDHHRDAHPGQPKLPGPRALAHGGIAIYRLAWHGWFSRDAEDHMAPGPDLRIGDADRETAAAHLREHYAQGRLTLEEFTTRLDAVFAATRRSQLSALTRDLPRTAAPSASLPPTAAGTGRERARREHRPGRRARLGVIPVIIAAVAAWLLIGGLHLRAFPWPGRLAIFLAIAAAVRWLIRRMWRAGRGGAYRGCGRYRGGR